MAVKTKAAPRRTRKGAADARFENSTNLSGAEFHRLRNSAVQYYYTEFKIVDLLTDLYAWMKDAGYSLQDIRDVKTVGTDGLSVVAVYARCLRSGMPDLHPEHAEYWASLDGTVGALRPVSEHIREAVDRALATVKPTLPAEEASNGAPKKTVQDHMRDRAVADAPRRSGPTARSLPDRWERPSWAPLGRKVRVRGSPDRPRPLRSA